MRPAGRTTALQEFFIRRHRRKRIKFFQSHRKLCQKPNRQRGHVAEVNLYKKRDRKRELPSLTVGLLTTLVDRSKHSQTAHAAVRENVEAHVGGSSRVHHFVESM